MMRKRLSLFLLVLLTGATGVTGQSLRSFDIVTCRTPAGFIVKEEKDKLFLQKTEGDQYCQLLVYPAARGTSDPDKDFGKNWDFFARNPAQGIGDPGTKAIDSAGGWHIVFGGATGIFNGHAFVVTVSTFTKADITFFIASVFTSETYLPVVQDFIGSLAADTRKFVKKKEPPVNATGRTTASATMTGITKKTTRFDDGWTATCKEEYVQVNRPGTEVRLYYTDDALDNARPNTVDPPEYYWSKYVEPYFNVGNPEKWSGVQYPVIYFMQGNATDKRTGNTCFVAIKIVYSGGARPIVVIAPDQNSYQQLFPHPNNLDPMLNSNRFAITANDITGTWKGSGGGGVEYYNAYSGTYAGMSAVSSTDQFIFNPDGTYSSKYRSASTNNGGAQFGGQDFNGRFSVTDWSITATNRYKGKTTTYQAQLIAVKNGFLLYMSDRDNSSMNYTLFKSK